MLFLGLARMKSDTEKENLCYINSDLELTYYCLKYYKYNDLFIEDFMRFLIKNIKKF